MSTYQPTPNPFNIKDKISMEKSLQLKKFKDISLSDPFFDSLKNDYSEFNTWFQNKAEQMAYVLFGDHGLIQAFLYLKEESEAITDVSPAFPDGRYLKIGTFKINAHGTKLGERLVKKAFDHAIEKQVKKIYVTVFPNHHGLISILTRFGFKKVAEKTTPNGVEDVLLKDMSSVLGIVGLDYPLVNLSGQQFLLSIYPEFHTRLFPDSILKTENAKIIDDVSHTNSIEKVYICRMKDVRYLGRGDALVIYRAVGKTGRPWFQSVATSFCMVEEVKQKSDFKSLNDYMDYCLQRSVFSKKELKNYFQYWPTLFVIKMTYNVALQKRPTMQRLVEEVGLSREEYWGFRKITKNQFKTIANLGGIDAGLIVD